MLQERYNRIVLPFLFFFDLSLTIILVALFYVAIDQNTSISKIIILTSSSWIVPSLIFKSYKVKRVNSKIKSLKPMFFTYTIFSIAFILIYSNNYLTGFSIGFLLLFLMTVLIVQTINSLLRYNFFLQYRKKGKNIRYAVLMGKMPKNSIYKFKKDALYYGYSFLEIISNSGDFINRIEKLLKKKKINIIFLYDNTDKKVTENIRIFCDQNGIRLKLILQISPNTAKISGLDIIGGLPIMDVRHEPLLYLGNRLSKRVLDIIISIFSIILVLTWLPILIKLVQFFTYPGSLFFVQNRIGRDGKIFKLYKFRTMYEEESNLSNLGHSKITKESDSRVSPFGKFLRKTNLDEYPQFINVLFGSMSTVGPRPYMVGEDIDLEKNVSRYKIRRFVKPGITGWAAVNGYRGGTKDLKLMTKRTDLDIWYLENWSFFLDLKIIYKTVLQMTTFNIPRAF